MADGVTIEKPDLGPEDPVREALATPYTLARWGEDLRALAKGAPTGFDALEAVGMRWTPGKVYGVAARPGAGKTAFMLEACVRYLEAHPDRHALFVSWEEPLAELVLRLMLRTDAQHAQRSDGAAWAGPELHRDTARTWGADRAAVSVPPWAGARLDAAAGTLEPLLARLHMVDGDALGHDIAKVLREVAAWMREADAPHVGLVAVDYFQKLRGPKGGGFFSRQHELQGVSDHLKRFAKGAALPDNGDIDRPDSAHAVPVLVGAQVTRGGGEHPSGDTIREADDLLNDAAAVLALSWEDAEGGTETDPLRVLRVSVPKHRDGRARPRETCGIPWRPARHYLAKAALQDGGAVRWSPIETGEEEERKPKKKRRGVEAY